MDVKNEILWRVYISFLGLLLVAVAIIVKIFVIQNVEGDHWRSLSKEMHNHYRTIESERGAIFSADGRMLSASIPSFDLHLDFKADGIQKDKGAAFFKDLDSLSLNLSHLFKDRSPAGYRQLLANGYKKGNRYFLLKRDISFEQYKALREFPYLRSGRNTSGLIVEKRIKRVNPFGLLANRTVGLYRDNAPGIGIEQGYNDYLAGVDGKMLVQQVEGGGFVPMEGYKIDPVNGKDVITTLDVNIQDIAENALRDMLVSNEAQYGSCTVMEVKTGQIKAMANLGRQPDGSYYEDYNYAIGKATEPGSVFKLATMISALEEDKNLSLDDEIDLENGTHRFANRIMRDVAGEETGVVTIKKAFEMSSNVGMSKLAYKYFNKQPQKYLNHLKALHLDQKTGIDLPGEVNPVVKTLKDKTWSHTTLPWMSIGYEVQMTPLNILMLYNAVANNGTMMKPYLVSAIENYGEKVKTFEPVVLSKKICSDRTLKIVRELLNGVVADKYGTGHRALDNPYFKISGKTGTAQVANGKYGYSQGIYQAAFVGFFPSDAPKYSVIVVIKNKPHAARYYGASVAAPVFKEVAHKLYAMDHQESIPEVQPPVLADNMDIKSGYTEDAYTILRALNVPVDKSSAKEKEDAYSKTVWKDKMVYFDPIKDSSDRIPDVRGMGLKDALYLLEKRGLNVRVEGNGRVVSQSLQPGQEIGKEKTINIQLS